MGRRKLNHESLVQLWELGLSDSVIGERLGITTGAARKRRNKLRLAANPDVQWKTQTSARRENEQPWEPPKGATKRRCVACLFWFSAWDGVTTRCPECVSLERL